jgi:flavin reductase (DIM6/NTAB) family NADH-FMN oxidoreductase RutF
MTPPDSTHFRSVLARFATGVTVVTSRTADGRGCGLTVNAFMSVSLDPMLVLVSLARDSVTADAITNTRGFAVNVLPAGAGAIAERFSEIHRTIRFRGVETRTDSTGSPVLVSALAWLDCQVHAIHHAGDHLLILGAPQALGARDGDPLVFFGGGYRELAP